MEEVGAQRLIVPWEGPEGSVKAWIICLTATLFFFYQFVQMTMFNSLNAELSAAFGINASKLSYLSACFFVGDVLFILPAGLLLDKFPASRLILMAMSFMVLGSLGFAFAHSFAFAAGCRFLTGVGTAFCLLCCLRIASGWFPPQKMAFITGLIITIGLLGGVMAQTPLMMLIEHFGWREALMMNAGLGVVLLLVMAWIVEESPHAKAFLQNQQSGEQSLSHRLKRAIKNPQTWLCGIYGSTLNIPIFVLGGLWGTRYLHDVHQLSQMDASIVLQLLFYGAIIGSPVFGKLSDTLKRRKIPMIFAAIFSMCTIIYILNHTPLTFNALCVSFFLLGFFTYAQILAFPTIAESNSPDITSTATSVGAIIIMSGGFSEFLSGWLMDLPYAAGQTIQYTLADYQRNLMMIPIGFAISLLASLLIRETFCKNIHST